MGKITQRRHVRHAPAAGSKRRTSMEVDDDGEIPGMMMADSELPSQASHMLDMMKEDGFVKVTRKRKGKKATSTVTATDSSSSSSSSSTVPKFTIGGDISMSVDSPSTPKATGTSRTAAMTPSPTSSSATTKASTKQGKRDQKHGRLMIAMNASRGSMQLAGMSGAARKNTKRRDKRRTTNESEGKKFGSTMDDLKVALSKSETHMKNREKANVVDASTVTKRKKLVKIEAKQFNAVLSHPSFKASPLDTLREHLSNKMKQEAEKKTQEFVEQRNQDAADRKVAKQTGNANKRSGNKGHIVNRQSLDGGRAAGGYQSNNERKGRRSNVKTGAPLDYKAAGKKKRQELDRIAQMTRRRALADARDDLQKQEQAKQQQQNGVSSGKIKGKKKRANKESGGRGAPSGKNSGQKMEM